MTATEIAEQYPKKIPTKVAADFFGMDIIMLYHCMKTGDLPIGTVTRRKRNEAHIISTQMFLNHINNPGKAS